VQRKRGAGGAKELSRDSVRPGRATPRQSHSKLRQLISHELQGWEITSGRAAPTAPVVSQRGVIAPPVDEAHAAAELLGGKPLVPARRNFLRGGRSDAQGVADPGQGRLGFSRPPQGGDEPPEWLEVAGLGGFSDICRPSGQPLRQVAPHGAPCARRCLGLQGLQVGGSGIELAGVAVCIATRP